MTKVALITGANRGIGLETARGLGRAGVKTIVGARDAAKGEQAAQQLRGEDLDVDWVVIDVDAAASVHAAAQQVRARHGRLDILVNNAGIMLDYAAATAPDPLDLRMFRQTFETNVFGAVTVIHEFLPLLRESDAGRIVNISSATASMRWQADPEWAYYRVLAPAYQSSKAALNAITVALAKYFTDTPIKVNSVCPGFTQTDITPPNRQHGTRQPDEASRIVVEMALIAADGPSGQFIDCEGAIDW